ncbi:MAG TPA: molecular chaperone HtpG [Gammaproteobacteria bacterium]|nr:molecular chaperone HtpG [Gammaproteobacteria bacterium]
MAAEQKETLGFQAEVKQLLRLMIHSLYSNKEIFLRELISNASDAADKLRFESLSDSALMENDADLKVHVSFDKLARTITITDNGIGMTRDEIISHLGTIAKSGTKEFFEKLSGDQAKDAHLIGQFGVGFYASFIVAKKVTVTSRRAGMTKDHGVRWESTGDGEYTVENIEKATRGTEIVLHVRDEEHEFLDEWRLRNIITKYSDHLMIPVTMRGGEKGETIETVNKATALWASPKADLKDEDYQAFYKHISHDWENPLLWSHNRVEGKQEYISLLYIPSHAPFDLYNREHPRGLKLYVKRVFIMDDADQFLPLYLRFVRGVLDSSDLPLNISREILQGNKLVDSMKSAMTKRVLSLLESLSTEDKEKYQIFWKNFGQVLKEGPGEDFGNKEQIAKLLRFSTTHNDSETQEISLDDYISRMKPEQEKIYFLTAENFEAAKNSPHLEIFRKKNIEVLLLSERVDEWLAAHLTTYLGKSLESITQGSLDLGKLEDEAEKQQYEKLEKDFESMTKQIKDILGERVKEVRLTSRLTTSPACIVADKADLGGHMQRILKSAGHAVPESKPIFEINPEHKLIHKLRDESDDARFKELTNILFDQAILSESGQLPNANDFVVRLNKFLLELI